MKEITIHNLGNLPTAPLDSFCELQEDFKISDPDKLAKLQMLIITRGFKYAFKAWRDPSGKLWIIDAHQRRKALIALRKSGFAIPEIPYEPIYAENKKEAIAKVLETIASPEVGIALANKSNCAPANSKAYDDADVAANEMIMAMKATAETAQPMPNIPQMSVMWGPAEAFLAAVNKSGEDIDTAAETYQQEALDAIADMQ